MRVRIDILMLGLALAGFPCAAITTVAAAANAAVPWPTQDAMDQARKTLPFPTLERLDRTPVPTLPRITPGVPGMDIEAIARRHLQLRNGMTAEQSSSPRLMIFVTLGMPAVSLRLLTAQAERAQATLVLRGLKAGSMKQTLDAVQALIGTRQVAWQIDPESFVRYHVRHAPTFVLMKHGAQTPPREACDALCIASDAYYSVAGDVSLDYALNALLRRYPGAQATAAPFMSRLRGTP